MKKSILAILLGVIIVIGGLIAGFSYSQTVNDPYAQTSQATNISNTSATLWGQVSPNGYATYYRFDYGIDQSLGSTTGNIGVGSNFSTNNVSYVVNNLLSGTTYYFRITAINMYGSSQGSILNFTTTGSTSLDNSGLSVTTNAATNISSNSATLHASAVTIDGQATVRFEYGTTIFNLDKMGIGTVVGNSNQQYLSEIYYNATDLIPNVTYYFRTYIQDSGRIAYGQLLSFQTLVAGYSGNTNNYIQPITYTQPIYYPITTYNPQTVYSEPKEVRYVYQTQPVTQTEPAVTYNYYYNTIPGQMTAYGYPGQGISYYPNNYVAANSNYPLTASVYSMTGSSLISILGYGLLVLIVVLLGVLYFRNR